MSLGNHLVLLAVHQPPTNDVGRTLVDLSHRRIDARLLPFRLIIVERDFSAVPDVVPWAASNSQPPNPLGGGGLLDVHVGSIAGNMNDRPIPCRHSRERIRPPPSDCRKASFIGIPVFHQGLPHRAIRQGNQLLLVHSAAGPGQCHSARQVQDGAGEQILRLRVARTHAVV